MGETAVKSEGELSERTDRGYRPSLRMIFSYRLSSSRYGAALCLRKVDV
jgi:hypothetical protein